MSDNSPRDYRATVIFDTRGYAEAVETLYDTFETALKDLGASVSGREEKGSHEFVYVTEKSHTGDVYVQFTFAAGPGIPAALQDHFRLEKTVKRILVTHA